MTTPSDNNMKLAALVAKTMHDPALRTELIDNTNATLDANGITVPSGVNVKVAQDGPNHLNIVVPTEKLPADAQVASINADSTLSEIYRWVITQVQTDGPQKQVVMSSPADAVRAAGANVPSDLTASILVDTDTLKHIVLPFNVSGGGDVPVSDSAVAAIAGGKGGGGGSVATSTYEVQTTATTTTVGAEAELEVVGAADVAAVAVAVAIFV